MEAGYYPRQVGEKGTLSKNDRGEQTKRKAVRTLLGCEGSKKAIPDLEDLEEEMLDVRSVLDGAAQNIRAKDNALEQLDKEKEKLQQA